MQQGVTEMVERSVLGKHFLATDRPGLANLTDDFGQQQLFLLHAKHHISMLKAPLLDIAHETSLWGAQLRLHAPGAAFGHLWGGLPKTGCRV